MQKFFVCSAGFWCLRFSALCRLLHYSSVSRSRRACGSTTCSAKPRLRGFRIYVIVILEEGEPKMLKRLELVAVIIACLASWWLVLCGVQSLTGWGLDLEGADNATIILLISSILAAIFGRFDLRYSAHSPSGE